jgi:hypothetical protein
MFVMGERELLSRHSVLMGSVIALSTLATGCLSISDPSIMRIRERKSKYLIRPPYSKISLQIPKGRLSRKQFRQEGESYNPNYFHFEDDAINLAVSGTFRPAKVFPGTETYWECQVIGWVSRDQPVPQDEILEDIGHWHTIIYDLTAPDGHSAHLRAHWVKEGIWIDLHLSMTSDQKQAGAKSRLLGLLRRIRVEIPAPPTYDHDWHSQQHHQKKR